MPECLTIFGLTREHEAIVSAVERVAGWRVEVDGPRDAWNKIVVSVPGVSLRFSRLVREAPQDRFSSIMLGTSNHIRGIPTNEPERKRDLIHRVGRSNVIIGVVAEPGLGADAGIAAYIDAVVDASRAEIILCGSDLFGPDRSLLLGSDGSYDP